jgi:hypothetical protein
VIAIVQEERVDLDVVDVVELDGSNRVTKQRAASGTDGAKPPAAVAVERNGSSAADNLPADPFA